MSNEAYRAGGSGETICCALAHSSLGGVLVAATRAGICALLLGDDPEALVVDLRRRFPRARIETGGPAFAGTVQAAIDAIDDPRAAGALPLDIRGTAFQHRVWQALREIPAGETISYADLASRIGAPGASRAVAKACAANPIAIAVPCHRVVRSDGTLSGYRWGGSERKRALLAREAAGKDRPKPRQR